MKKIETRSDLFRTYGDIIDMCEISKFVVPPVSCVRFVGMPCVRTPDFLADVNAYEFCLVLLDGKPVFTGDVLYHKDGYEYTVEDVETHIDGRIEFRSGPDNKHDGDWAENYTWAKTDEYAHLRKAIKDGKRVALQSSKGDWIFIKADLMFILPACRYKIVEDDIVEINHFPKLGCAVRLTKCGVTGKISVEVIK